MYTYFKVIFLLKIIHVPGFKNETVHKGYSARWVLLSQRPSPSLTHPVPASPGVHYDQFLVHLPEVAHG